MNKEHETLATSSAGGNHQQGSARAFWQDGAPTTQIDGTAWTNNDTGSLWFDTNSSPDNLVYVLTNYASTGTWTLLSTSMVAEIVAAAHSWADVQTFDLQTVHTLGILSNGNITLGAGDDLVGSATSDITINTNKFTVSGATGDTLIGGKLDLDDAFDSTSFATGRGGFKDENDMLSNSDTSVASQQSIKVYVDTEITASSTDGYTPADYTNDGSSDSRESVTFPNGMIMKTGSTGSNSGTVTFDTPFPNGVVSVFIQQNDAASSGTANDRVDTLTVSSFDYFVVAGDAPNVYWFAIGY
jgi:hypothetical protein